MSYVVNDEIHIHIASYVVNDEIHIHIASYVVNDEIHIHIASYVVNANNGWWPDLIQLYGSLVNPQNLTNM